MEENAGQSRVGSYLCFSPSSSSSLSCLAFGSPSSLSCKGREKTTCSDERSYFQSTPPRQQTRNRTSREPATLARTSLAFQPLSGHGHDAAASPLTPQHLGKIQAPMTPAQAHGGPRTLVGGAGKFQMVRGKLVSATEGSHWQATGLLRGSG